MCVLARNRAEHTQGRSNGVAAALDRELNNVGRIEVVGILSERRACRMLNALIDRQDREVAGATEAPSVVHRLQVAEYRHGAVRIAHHALDEVGAGKMQAILIDRRAGMPE